MNNVGLHIRLADALPDIIQKVVRLNMPIFQCFLSARRGTYISITPEEKKKFLAARHQQCSAAYLHGSYWINLCNDNSRTIALLERELTIARELAFTHLVVHPGSAKKYPSKQEGICALACLLNNVLKSEHDITIVLENTAHGRRTVGSDLYDFQELLGQLDHPEKVAFCLDTAHAYSYGYDLADVTGQDQFIALAQETIGLDRVQLIHLNDTQETLGKRIDCHHAPGEGNIGDALLRRFITHPALQNVPVILELPVMEEEGERQMLDKVQAWRTRLPHDAYQTASKDTQKYQ